MVGGPAAAAATGPVVTEPLVLRSRGGGCELKLRVKPNAREDRVIGLHGGALKISVRAAPEKGRANESVCALLAAFLNVPAAAVHVKLGTGSADKMVQIEGLDSDECRRRIEAKLAGTP